MSLWSKSSGAPAARGERVIQPGTNELLVAPGAVPNLRLDPASDLAASQPQLKPLELSEDDQERLAAASSALMTSYGEIMSVLMRSPRHASQRLADLEWLVSGAILTGQYSLARIQAPGIGLAVPVGAIFWASVSGDVDRRLSANPSLPAKLEIAEWISGTNLWVVESIGDPTVIRDLLLAAADQQWGRRPAKIRARDQTGSFVVGRFGPAPVSGNADAG
jgi:hemolysin-activating ACP:hemolysin acyltransferase